MVKTSLKPWSKIIIFLWFCEWFKINFYTPSKYQDCTRMEPLELALVTFELSFIMITCIFMVFIFVRRCMRLRHMKRRYMARRPKISLIYSPSPRSSTLPLPFRDGRSSFDDILSEVHLSQFSTSSKARKSNSLPVGHESSPGPQRLGFSGKEVLIWKISRLNKILLLQTWQKRLRINF